MRREAITPEISSLAVDFFFGFSRFEFALKANGYLKSHKLGAKAEPGWTAFVEKWKVGYESSPEAVALVEARPEQQIVDANGDLAWRPVDLRRHTSELARVVCLLKTVRNNLFHGGKHGDVGWDDPERTKFLLTVGKRVLDQLVQLASLEADYRQQY